MATDKKARGLAAYSNTAAGISAAGGALSGGVYNNTPVNLQKWRAALANVRTGQANAKVICVGDSTTAGIGDAVVTVRSKSYPSILATQMTSYVVPAQVNSIWGDANLAATYATYDTRVVRGAGWGWSLSAPGGQAYLNSTDTTALAFTPSENTDTLDVYYYKTTSGATWTVDVGGAVLTTVNSAASTAIALSTTTTTLAANTWNIKRNGTGTNAYIIGVHAYNSAIKKVGLFNTGVGGAKTTRVSADSIPTDVCQQIRFIAPDLTIINLSINDWLAGYDVTTAAANLQTCITAAKASGDVVLMVPNPTSSGTALIPAYQSAIKALGAANGCVVIDLVERWVSQSAANALGYFAPADGTHPSYLGYDDIASAVMKVIGRP